MRSGWTARLAIVALAILGLRFGAETAPHLHPGLDRALEAREIAHVEADGACREALHWHAARTQRAPVCRTCLASATPLERPQAAGLPGAAPSGGERRAPAPPPRVVREPAAPCAGRAPPLASDTASA